MSRKNKPDEAARWLEDNKDNKDPGMFTGLLPLRPNEKDVWFEPDTGRVYVFCDKEWKLLRGDGTEDKPTPLFVCQSCNQKYNKQQEIPEKCGNCGENKVKRIK